MPAIRALVVALLTLSWPLPPSVHAQDAEGGEEIINQSDHALLRPFRWRSIGPVGQGGRVDDIAVSPDDVHTFLVGFATGGLWKTTNNGVTFTPDLRHLSGLLHRRHRDRPFGRRYRVGGYGGAEQSPELVFRGRRLPVLGRR